VSDRPTPQVDSAPLELGLVLIREISWLEIQPCPDNEKLYKPVLPDDPEIQALAESIRHNGIMEPLVVTSDGYILSGHRRFVAAVEAGLFKMPCRVEEQLSYAANRDECLLRLREFNRQREKSIDERLREEIVCRNPEETHQALIEHRERSARVGLKGIVIRGARLRAEISDAKKPFLAAVLGVLEQMKDFLPLSVRQIHYRLLNDPPLKHASKSDSIYRNDLSSYKALDELLTRARLDGSIEMDVIADETRPVVLWRVWDGTQGFIRRELNECFRGYHRNLLQSQPNQIELVVEKNTVLGLVKPVAMRYCLPITSGRGYCSLPPRFQMAQRFKESGKQKLVVLVLSDLDPDGQEIAHSFARTMRDDFAVEDIVAIQVALTQEQVQRYQLPRNMTAKETSSNYQRFVNVHGEDTFELEAMQPQDLQDELRRKIDSVIDTKMFNAELDKEKSDSVELDAIRQRIVLAAGNL